jgi:hypothetical protein
MSAGGDQYDHIFQAYDALEFVEQSRDNGPARLGPRPVTDGDSDRLAGPGPLAKGQPAHGPAQGSHDRGPAVRRRWRVGGDYYLRAVFGQLDAQPGRAIGELDFHAH